MDAFFTPTDNGRLATYHYQTNAMKSKMRAILICNPIGQEYIRFYKGLTNLALDLQSEGFETFRFDYSGTGDSEGELTGIISIETWETNIKNIIQDIKDGTEVEKITIIAVRIGAMLSLQTWNDDMVDSIILWNPIFDGEKYLEEMDKVNSTFYSGSFAKQNDNSEYFESFGFRFHFKLIEMIKSKQLNNIPNNKKIYWLDDQERNSEFKNKNKLQSLNPDFIEEFTANSNFWKKSENEADKAIVPRKEIELIKEWILQI